MYLPHSAVPHTYTRSQCMCGLGVCSRAFESPGLLLLITEMPDHNYGRSTIHLFIFIIMNDVNLPRVSLFGRQKNIHLDVAQKIICVRANEQKIRCSKFELQHS